ncbi:MAG: TonB family protein [Hyphomonadaceae bacterium]
MLVRATRTASALASRLIFYAALFVAVVVLHLALSSALQRMGWQPRTAQFASGAAVLLLVLILAQAGEWAREWRAARREVRRMQQRLPSGPCCVIWNEADSAPSDDEAMPWDIVGPVRARYPQLARRFGIEGVAIAEFEVSAEGRAKNIHCVDAWPSDVFFEAAREALALAQFEPKPDVHPRFGATFRMPFVFRIAGASRTPTRGRRAKPLRPVLHAAKDAVEKLRSGA